jgi:hypothetical protein
MSCFRLGRGASPAATTYPATVSPNGLASFVMTVVLSTSRAAILLPRPRPSLSGRGPASFPRRGFERWRSRRARDREAVTCGAMGAPRAPSGVPFARPAWTRTPTPVATTIFAGAGRWWRAACAIGMIASCRRLVRTARAAGGSVSGIVATPPAWFVFVAIGRCGASLPRAPPRHLNCMVFSECSHPSSRSRSAKGDRRRMN